MCACICLDAVGIGFAFGCFFNLTKKSIETETDRSGKNKDILREGKLKKKHLKNK